MSKEIELRERGIVFVIGIALGVLATAVIGAVIAENRAVAEPIAVKEDVPDAVAIASLKDYASLEAERMVKMAAALMDMGGSYEASCSATQDTKTDTTEIEYRITWGRIPDDQPNETPQIWSGANWEGKSWAECLGKMMAWKKGGE